MSSSVITELEKNGRYYAAPSGNSMKPMLYNKENVVEIERAVHPLRKYDLSLHFREDGTKVLHRIVKVCDGCYVIRGDNCFYSETVPFDRVIGVGKQFYRKGKWISVTDWKYRLYATVWCGLYPVRKCLFAVRQKVKKCLGNERTSNG